MRVGQEVDSVVVRDNREDRGLRQKGCAGALQPSGIEGVERQERIILFGGYTDNRK